MPSEPEKPPVRPPSDEIASAPAPDAANLEQEDESTQAQTIADEALGRAEGAGEFGLDDTEKVKTGDETDDVQDLVDHMRQMETSGRIDMSAYRGERNDDEEEGRYGTAAEED
ncbi:MAG TPA: hypothetical protein VFP14_00545 [Novosphingobium sp.]|nr:hypothetical protein [Novosphingobium sp.]